MGIVELACFASRIEAAYCPIGLLPETHTHQIGLFIYPRDVDNDAINPPPSLIFQSRVMRDALLTRCQLFVFSSPNSGALSLTVNTSIGNPSSVKSEPMSPGSHLRPPSNSGMPGSPHSIHSHHSPVGSPVPPDYEQTMSKRPRMDTGWNQC